MKMPAIVRRRPSATAWICATFLVSVVDLVLEVLR